MMIMMGIWWVISGLIAILNSEFYAVTLRWIFEFDIVTWGWIHLILGIVVGVAGFFLFRGATWARIVGVVLAVIAGLVAFAWLPYYPIFAVIFIAISIGVIWALTVHGHDIPIHSLGQSSVDANLLFAVDARLSLIPDEDLTPEPLELPPRQEAGDYQHPDISQFNIVPARYP